MIKFGPSGTCFDFAESGYNGTKDIPKWIKDNGLDCFEYSFGRGVNMKDETAKELGEIFKIHKIEISVHAPYYINFASVEEVKAENSFEYIEKSLNALSLLGGKRCVFHPGSPLKNNREDAFKLLLNRMNLLAEYLSMGIYKDFILCPETMGKKAQLGTLDEIIEICKIYKNFYPCIDFGHLNARDTGSIKSYDDYKKIADKLFDNLDEVKVKNMHIHFSKIEYTQSGELRHLTFADNKFGPDYEPLIKLISDYKLTPYIVSESAGYQTREAKIMKNYYKKINNQ